MTHNKLVIISGCSGGGKSVLLEALDSYDYATVPEVGREIVRDEIANSGTSTPWQDAEAFCELLITESIAVYHRAEEMPAQADIVFFDRSLLDGISYYQTLNVKNKYQYDYLLDEIKYYPTVFLTPPWQEIFHHDNERRHSFDEAESEYFRLVDFYKASRYSVIDIPKVGVKERVEFVLSYFI